MLRRMSPRLKSRCVPGQEEMAQGFLFWLYKLAELPLIKSTSVPLCCSKIGVFVTGLGSTSHPTSSGLHS